MSAFTTLFLAALLLAGCAALRSDGPDGPPSEGIDIQWGVITNTPPSGDGFVSELVIRNQGEQVLPAEGWALYFNFARPVDTSTVTPTMRIEHLNGDFYRLTPTAQFPALGSGSRARITFSSGAWGVSESDAPRGMYFVWGDEEIVDPVESVTILPFETADQTQRGAADQLPVETPAMRYEENANLHELPREEIPKVIPRPRSATYHAGTFTIDQEIEIGRADGLSGEAEYLASLLLDLVGTQPEIVESAEAGITLRLDDALDDEGYRLEVADDITITGGTPAGVFYGIQTLRSLLPLTVNADPPARYHVQRVTIEDAPRFPYRGMHLDVARNFQSLETVKRLLDLMAMYKLNRFHFHLSDDEGWRLAIEGLPELTEVGGRRGHTLTEEDHLAPSLGSGPFPGEPPGSGYYTRDEFIDLLRHASRLHIEVVPEIDLPGHARAAILAMEARSRRTGDDSFRLADPLDTSEYESVQMFDDNVVNVCMPSAYRFIEAVVDDIVGMYDDAGVPLRTLHTGGDEVPHGAWAQSPACETLLRQSDEVDEIADLHDYFLRRFDAILDQHGITTAGWEEIALTERSGRTVPNPAFVSAGFQPYVWNAVWGWGSEDTAYRLANAGYDVVLANANVLYLDHPYAKHPEEPGLYWAGYIPMKAPFAFIPFDLYRSAADDLMGRRIADDAYEDAARLTMAGRENVLGLQGQLWGEMITTPERIEFMLFPRLLSLAERAWAERPDWALVEDDERRLERMNADWNVFANAIGVWHLPRLDRIGVHYRLPPPGAVIENGVLKANSSLPGLPIRYTTDGTQPSLNALVYTEPIQVQGPVHLRTFSTDGRGSRTVTVTP